MTLSKSRLTLVKFSSVKSHIQSLIYIYKRPFLIGSVLILGALFWGITSTHSSLNHRIELKLGTYLAKIAATTEFRNVFLSEPKFKHTVVKGDTLSKLFIEAGLPQSTMYKVLEADLDVLVLDSLLPDNIIEFWVNDEGGLQKLVVFYNAAKQIVFTRILDGSFQVEIVKHEGVWQHRTVSGEITDSFYQSAISNGLTDQQVLNITNVLENKFNFSRDIRSGDKFKVLLDDQYIDGDATGESKILAVYVLSINGTYSAFQFSDGNFYDENGHNLYAEFQRIPLNHKARMSSKFNPHRKHPITGRITSHNGTDFAVPVGTKVLATSDGRVEQVTKHPYAGNYIVIEHSEKYQTRYLHLSKSLVKKGQKVSKGQIIALSGNTGRTTGPHLHYELHVNGSPVNPLTAKIPSGVSLTRRQFINFLSLVKRRKIMMDLS
ncbi:peptidoglycan DD-metalloendopeptidase family protein [Parashewanella spongiae]|uniref:peptidoglycan DD-metalloendopeptidase family protein n=1 Tax=Parashewanella spongiae TaxID=342950 RepID=UPI001FB3D047|nr:peptidoglycan DD-metalloendopeptidase family protein [Parashewanella spongiae]MCL1078961.1 peptidoglycan DD-metalloendopeptidase family protein [Parashewanella spongiae]